MVKTESNHRKQHLTVLASYYNDKIRPLLDAVDRLRTMKVMQEGIELPTTVVVGDQSSGKSSVLESLAGISLPRGQGICTRVPLIMRLQNSPSLVEPQLQLEYKDKVVSTTEANITVDINTATDEIAGNGKRISNTPITLVVKKNGVPDLTMVDLPGITRVPVAGQPVDIYEQVVNVIKKCIAPKESIILNVLSATVDFPTCESIRLSQQVDVSGERTLAVVTKADKAPEGLLEKVIADDVNIGLGYVCVRNRIGEESYEKARAEETLLFSSHPLLSKIHKSMVGVPVLAERLMEIQASSIIKCFPDIVKKINDKLSRSTAELDEMPISPSNTADAMRAFMRALSMSKESLRKLLVQGNFDEFPDEVKMHATARVADILNEYSANLPSNLNMKIDSSFLLEEMEALKEAQGISLSNFVPIATFQSLLKRRIKEISEKPIEFVMKIWDYLETLVLQVLNKHFIAFPQLKTSIRSAAQNITEKMRQKSLQTVKELVKMESIAAYTSSPEYNKKCVDLLAYQAAFVSAIQSNHASVELKGFGTVRVGHLRNQIPIVQQAFELRMKLVAYWSSVILRLVDAPTLHILYRINCLVDNELEEGMVNGIVKTQGGNGFEKMLEESPANAAKRERLRKSIELLKESKEVVSNMMDNMVNQSN